MASFASVATLPFPTCSSSDDDSDDAKPLPPLPTSEEICPPQQHQQQPQWRQLERDCNVAMKALARAGDVDQVLALFAELRTSGTPSVLCYNTLLNALVEAGHVEEAPKVFDEMCASGVRPDASSHNIFLKLRSWTTDHDDSPYKVIIRMQELGMKVDVSTYSTIVTGLCRAGKLLEAWGLLEWMQEAGCRPMVHTYTPIVQGYCREGRVKEAMDLMATMEAADCPPNVVTYNVLIRALCDAGQFNEVKQLLMESRTKGWTPSIVTYNTFMNGLCKKGKAKEALALLGVMLGKGLDPTDFTLSILLNCLCHASRISHARYLLERSTSSSRWYAGVVAYNTVMGRLCEMGHWRGVLKLLTDMIKKGVMPNTRTFNIAIRSLCIGRKCSAAKSLVCNQGFAANVVTYNTLIDWFFYHRTPSEVGRLMSDMAAGNIAVDEVTYTIFVVRLCRDGNFAKASSCFLKSLENGLSMDLLGVLINRLAYNGKITETILIFQNMRERKGFSLDNSVFDLTIERFCRAGYCHDKYIHNLNSILDAMLGKQ
ncbi:pentatricopeptide repeat-containing protein At5g65560-like [Triticum dicoccoides]|uniref:Pentatricopeptide repeat-containing protein n=1 Tax=Triticum turgidum subsp. durum TaxID=4567 RepID=A0A9R0QDL9_TRITD|nr:pentatricopeptide repeat-containing protein At5g65560-like [Triticum dicoccoides]VAH08102.1 unnamed protein product [Triticum turgidum subsp. durum]